MAPPNSRSVWSAPVRWRCQGAGILARLRLPRTAEGTQRVSENHRSDRTSKNVCKICTRTKHRACPMTRAWLECPRHRRKPESLDVSTTSLQLDEQAVSFRSAADPVACEGPGSMPTKRDQGGSSCISRFRFWRVAALTLGISEGGGGEEGFWNRGSFRRLAPLFRAQPDPASQVALLGGEALDKLRPL